ncbi:hypothetical protein D6C87_06131 [Aureobasidium pullulans]|nr:hypothetical protein D6C87_06131 [Aureobasidium pullulans]
MEGPSVVPDSLDFHAECRAVDFIPTFRTSRDIYNHEPCQGKNITDNHGRLTEGNDCFEQHDEGNSDGDDNEHSDQSNINGEDDSDEEDDSDSDYDGSDETDNGNDDSSDYDSEDDYPSENDSKHTSPYREWIDYESSLIPHFHLAAPQNKMELAIHKRKMWCQQFAIFWTLNAVMWCVAKPVSDWQLPGTWKGYWMVHLFIGPPVCVIAMNVSYKMAGLFDPYPTLFAIMENPEYRPTLQILNRHPHRRAQVPNNSGSWSPRCYWLEDLEDSLYSDDEESDTDEDDSENYNSDDSYHSENDSSEDSQLPSSSSPSNPAAQTSTTTTSSTLLVTIAHSFYSFLSCGMLLPLFLISPFLWISKRYFHIG